MIRLIRLSIPRLTMVSRDLFSSKRLFKNTGKEPPRPPEKTKNEPASNRKSFKKQAPEGTAQQEHRQSNSKYRPSFPHITSLLSREEMESLQRKLGAHQPSLKEWMEVMDREKGFIARGQAEFEMLRLVAQGLIAAEIQPKGQLLRYIMDRYFCSRWLTQQNYDSSQDSLILEFVNRYRAGIDDFLRSADIKTKLRFYALIKNVSYRKSNNATFRPILHDFNGFFYPLIEQDFQCFDFSSEGSHEILQQMVRIINEYTIIHLDARLISSICTQVPFFSPHSITHFLVTYPVLVEKMDKGTLMAVLDVLELDSHAEVSPKRWILLIDALAHIPRTHEEVSSKIERLFYSMLTKMLEGQAKDGSFVMPRGDFLDLLIEISKLVLLDGQCQQSKNLFAYFRHWIDALSRLSAEEFYGESNLLFQLLTILTNNRFISKSIFASEFSSLETALQRLAVKRGEARQTYLWKFIKNKTQKIQVFNASWLLQLSSRKLSDLIEEIAASDDPQLAKSLILVLVDSQCKEAPLITLRNMLPEHTFHHILTRLLRSLMRLDRSQTLLAVFTEAINRQEFSEIALELLQSLHGLPDACEKEIIEAFLETVIGKTQDRSGIKKTLSLFIEVLQMYINSPKLVKHVLASPAFYYLLVRMLAVLPGVNDVSQFKVNVYKLLLFLLDDASSPYVIDSIIEHGLRHLNFSPDDYRLEQFVSIRDLERHVFLFKLDHVVPPYDADTIRDKLEDYTQMSQRHREIVRKLSDTGYIPEGEPNRDNLVVFMSDPKGVSLLQPYLDTVRQIIQQSTVKELAIVLYNCSVSPITLSSATFSELWNAFLSQLQDLRQVICLYLVEKYAKTSIPSQLFLKLLFKMMQFYGEHSKFFSCSQHMLLISHIKSQFLRRDFPQAVKEYATHLHTFIQLPFYANRQQKQKILSEILSLGFPVKEEELREVKSKLLEQEFAFYTLITHQEGFGPGRMSALLKAYLNTRSRLRQLDLPEVDTYISMNYPELSSYLTAPPGSKLPFHLKEYCDRQYSIQSRLQRRYKGLVFHQRSFCLTNESHLLAFCLRGNRHFDQFRYKFFRNDPAYAHLKVHLFDFSEIDQPAFFERLEKEGIVPAPSTAPVQAHEPSVAERLAQEVAEARKKSGLDSSD